MLYITTRGSSDAFTAHRTLMTGRAPDGGLFIPMRFPCFSVDEIHNMVVDSFEATVANVFNLFFRTGLTQWDVGFCIGRNTMRIVDMNPKIYFTELWHNPGNGIDYINLGLFRRVFGEETEQEPTEWFQIVVKVAIIFGIYGELCRQKTIKFGDRFDLSVPADDFSYPMAAVYASKMGLPLGKVICNCFKSHSLWNLLHRGELVYADMNDDLAARIERLILFRLDGESASVLQNERVRYFDTEEHGKLKAGLFCVVSGSERAVQAITSTFRNTEKLVTPDAALCIAGLGDYRAKTGESRFTLVIEENSPALYPAEVERATGISARKIGDYLKE